MENDIHNLAPLYVVNSLDLDEQAVFEEHLASCKDCQQEVSQLGDAVAVMAESVSVEPPNMLEEILSKISTIHNFDGEPISQVPDHKNNYVKRVLTLAALPIFALMLLAAGWAIASNLNTSELTDADLVLAAEDAAISDLEGSDGSVSITWSESLGKVVVVSTNVPQVEEDSVHQLWVIDNEGNPESVGLLELGDTEQAVSTLELNNSNGILWGITVEPTGGSPLPTGDIIYSGDV